MNRVSRFAIGLSFAAAACFCVAAVAQDEGQDPNQGQDPARATWRRPGPSYTTEAPPPPRTSQCAAARAPDDSDTRSSPGNGPDQPPPPLPDYQQPPAPGDGYIWTPGYWAWCPNGYYWVPGAWVEPPYIVRCGPRDIGDFMADAIVSIRATGACISVSMAESITASGM